MSCVVIMIQLIHSKNRGRFVDMITEEEKKRMIDTYDNLCEKHPPKDQSEKNGLMLLAYGMSTKKGRWDDFSDIIRPFSYIPHFGDD